MRRFLVTLLALIAIAAAIGIVCRRPLALFLAERVIARTMGASLLDELPDGLHVALCGAGSPLPDPDRSGPCVAVIGGRRLYVIDSGSGTSRSLARMRLPQGRVAAVFLTHFHSDHIDGLGELMLQRWVNGAHDSPMPVYGPSGVEAVVEGFNRAYAQDSIYRVAHHGEGVVPRAGAGGSARPFGTPADGEELVALIERGASTAGRANIEKIAADILDYHTTPVEAAAIARDASAGYLLYDHIVPPLPLAPLEEVFLEGVDEVYEGPVTIGDDGTFLSLPAGSDAVVVKNLL
jgi:hypothetical protein